MTTEHPSGQNRKLGRLFRSAVCVCVCVCVLHAVPFMKAQYTHVQMGCFKMDIHIEVLTQIIYIYTQACKYTTIKKVNSYTERKSWQKNATVNDPCKLMFYI